MGYWETPYPQGVAGSLFKDQTIYSGSTLPKDKAASRRQYEQYGKASQGSILAKEAAISEYADFRGGRPETP